jgi:ubiquitin carboxyl-terminal hydrolase 8
MNTFIKNKKDIIKEYEDKGLTGLVNIGNTCYLNSCMQVLSHTYELNFFLKNGEYKEKLNKVVDSIVLLEWDKLREIMWTNNCTVAPHGFVNAIRKVAKIKNRDIFTGYAQNDLQEFLLFIIDCLHNSLARVVDIKISGITCNETDELAKTCYTMIKDLYNKEYSEILGIFFGIHVSEISNVDTNKSLSLRPEPFSVLSLSIPDNNQDNNNDPISIYQCFDKYCEKELMDGENQWFNEKKNIKETVNRGIIFWSLPEILIIDLKRWNGYNKKNNILIETPLKNVDFSKYIKGYNKETYIYDLYGVCNHHGNISGGHYTANIKNANGKWHKYNDSQVIEINETQIITQQAYCFFYRKIQL